MIYNDQHKGENSMEINARHLKPGMILMYDINGISGKPIVRKNTVLTEIEIEFIQKFLIEKVSVTHSPLDSQEVNLKFQHERITSEKQIGEKSDPFLSVYQEVTEQFKSLFASWQANIPVKMYRVRELCLPLFELVEAKTLSEIKTLLTGRAKDIFYYKIVAVSVLSIKLAQLLGYDKKDWLQIGFAAILADIGFAKSNTLANVDQANRSHPVLSYKMIKDEATLTKNAKIAIIQHHERLDGTGFPLQITAEQIHPFARIIAVSDRYFTLYLEVKKNIERYMVNEIGKFSENIVRVL